MYPVQNAPDNVSMILLGNKCDVDDERTVSMEAAEQVTVMGNFEMYKFNALFFLSFLNIS